MEKNNIRLILTYILAIFLFIAALGAFMSSFFSGIFMLIAAFIVLPKGHKWVEEQIKKSIPRGTTVGIVIALMFVAMLSSPHKSNLTSQEAGEGTALAAKIQEEQKLAEQEKDSLRKYTALADSAFKVKNVASAAIYNDQALRYAKKDDIKNIIANAAKYKHLLKQWEDAIKEYTTLIGLTHKDSIYYQRALCYIQQKQIKEAAQDLQIAIKLGYKEAETLHNKINPIKRKLIGTETRCCDGSTSYSTGKGACSHHGGVCNWNAPVYREFREY